MVDKESLSSRPSGALRVAFKHLEEAENRTKKAAGRLEVEIDLRGDPDSDEDKLVDVYRTIRELRKQIGEEIINRDEPLEK